MENKTGFITKMLLEKGAKVGFAYREQPDNENDSGWRFLTGKEDQNYVDNADNLLIYTLEEILKIDSSIGEILSSDYGTAYEKKNNKFVKITNYHFGNF